MIKRRISPHTILYFLPRTFFALIICLIGIGSGFVSAISQEELVRYKKDYDQRLKGWSQTSTAYFKREIHAASAQKIGDLVTPEDRKLVRRLDEVNPYLINAFLAGEDRFFFKHNGIVPTSLFRAIYQQLRGDEIATGGSTITQQLVKNEILRNSEKTYKRKTLEMINALRIERYYTKEEILVAYMNSAYFGKGVHNRHMYGVSSAARGLFSKDVKDLQLPEAAYLAGMVQRPNAYIPFGSNAKQNLQRGIKRMYLVLKQMRKYHFISDKKYEEATTYNIKGALTKKESITLDYERFPFLLNAIEKETIEILQEIKYKKPGQKSYRGLIKNGGLRIYTTIDQKIYTKMNSIPLDHIPHKKIYGKTHSEQIGAVLMQNSTGEIISFYSGTNFQENQKDHAFEVQNQPGSAIKPLLGYGPAINEGLITKDSIIIDEPIKKAYSLIPYVNATGKYLGPITVSYALQWSLNIPAVKIFRTLGFKKGFAYLKKMDLAPHKSDGEASILGGVTRGYTVKQMTAAYAMIANHGIYNKPYLISRITTSEGKEIYKRASSHTKIFRSETTFELTGMLQRVVKSGTARSIGSQTEEYDIAGKTGSTNNDKDFWFIGYTPTISLGVWSGYDYKTPAWDLSKRAWLQFFRALNEARPNLVPKRSKFKILG